MIILISVPRLGTAHERLPNFVIEAAVEVDDEAEPLDAEVSDIEQLVVLGADLTLHANASGLALIGNGALGVELGVGQRFVLRHAQVAAENHQHQNRNDPNGNFHFHRLTFAENYTTD